MSAKEKVFLRLSVSIDGPTKVLRITDLNRMQDSDSLPEAQNYQNQFEVELSEAGISLIDNTPQELLYFSFKNINYDYMSSITEQIHEFRIKQFQVDNQMLTTTFPVMLCSSAPLFENMIDESYFFHLSVVKSKLFTSIDYFHYFKFLIQEIYLKADDTIINQLLSFVQMDSFEEPNFETDEQNQEIIIPKAAAKKLYIERLELSPIKCSLTFNYANLEKKINSSNSSNSTSSSTSTSSSPNSDNPVKTVLNAIGVAVANIEDAPIYLNSLNISHAFETREEMVKNITKHFYMQLLSEVYKVVFSFDIIGNPVSLVHNLGTGVYDFFYEPAKGFVKSPKEFVIGVRKGSTSLVKNSVAGIFNTASKITGSLSKGVAHLAFDKEYVRQREKNNREKAKNVTQGISVGAKELGTGLFKGITGVVTAPLSGAKKEGVGGMIKGLGKGVIGAAVKPGVGIFDMCTRTTQGIKNHVTLGGNDEVRTRPPRGFGPDKVLLTYDSEKAIGQSILRTLDQGYYEDQYHLFHCISLEENLVLVSNKKLFYINVGEQLIQWACDIVGLCFCFYLVCSFNTSLWS
jgi:vacuolar protein sorting-associated protein 13A/C